jgi:hypothetical protein
MTLQGSGQIGFSDVSNETGGAFSNRMSWIQAYTKDGVTSLGGLYNRAWYARNVDGNCNNGNCACDCNCGNINCNNCTNCYNINCTNCDGQNWLQGNCNCACTYNCDVAGTVSFNCNCDCTFCACACW